GHAIQHHARQLAKHHGVPALAERAAMPAALMLFCAGVLALGAVAYVLGALGFQIARRRAV
ncbi:MAG: hypothetical protein AAFY52_12485, partial [Pseudomonadota bacterium]